MKRRKLEKWSIVLVKDAKYKTMYVREILPEGVLCAHFDPVTDEYYEELVPRKNVKLRPYFTGEPITFGISYLRRNNMM